MESYLNHMRADLSPGHEIVWVLSGLPDTSVILHGVVDAKTHASFHHGAYVHEAVQPPLLQEGDEDPDGARDAASAEAHFASGKFTIHHA